MKRLPYILLLGLIIGIVVLFTWDWGPKVYTYNTEGSSGLLYVPPGRKPTFLSTEHYNYTATPERQAAILNNLGRLAKGMNRSQVRTILGPPDIDDAHGTESIPVRLSGYAFRYLLRASEWRGGDPGDSFVDVLFDDHDHLYRILFENVKTPADVSPSLLK